MKEGILNNKIIFFVIIGEISSPVYSQRFLPDNISSVSWFDDRIPTVKLKIPGKAMGKVGYRTSVTFKL